MALPAATDFTGSNITEAQFKTAMADLRGYLATLLGTSGTHSSAQAALGALLGAGVLAKSTAYTISATDRGKIISAAGTWALTLPPAATVGAGFAVAVFNAGPGVITVTPNGTEQIDSGANMPMNGGSTSIVVSTGSAWITIGRGSGGAAGRSVLSVGSHHFTVPPSGDVSVLLVGGGGGGGGFRPAYVGTSPSNGSNGGSSSFGSYLSALGGKGGGKRDVGVVTDLARFGGATASADDGVSMIYNTAHLTGINYAAGVHNGGSFGLSGSHGVGGAPGASDGASAQKGGPGGVCVGRVKGLAPGATVVVTVGDGGNGGDGGSSGGSVAGEKGQAGIAIITW